MPEQPSLDEQNGIKKRAVRRVIVASVLLAAAIAALTVLTRYKSEVSVTRTTTPVTVLSPVTQPESSAPTPEQAAQNGVKSYSETKLHVSPLQSKAEADQALAKIRSPGVSAVVVPVR